MAMLVANSLLVLEDSLLQNLAVNAQITRLVPVLKNLNSPLARGTTRCGKCGRPSAPQRAALFQQVKQAIAALPNDRKVELKRMLNTRQLRIMFRNSAQKTIVMTF